MLLMKLNNMQPTVFMLCNNVGASYKSCSIASRIPSLIVRNPSVPETVSGDVELSTLSERVPFKRISYVHSVNDRFRSLRYTSYFFVLLISCIPALGPRQSLATDSIGISLWCYANRSRFPCITSLIKAVSHTSIHT